MSKSRQEAAFSPEDATRYIDAMTAGGYRIIHTGDGVMVGFPETPCDPDPFFDGTMPYPRSKADWRVVADALKAPVTGGRKQA